MTQYREFPDITIPSILDNSEWKDTSWHNDACAKSEYKHILFNDLYLSVWVDYDNPNERELLGDKYWIIIADNLTGDIWESYTFSTNDLAELENELSRVIEWLAV